MISLQVKCEFRKGPCLDCDGNGFYPSSITCVECDGFGELFCDTWIDVELGPDAVPLDASTVCLKCSTPATQERIAEAIERER